MSDTAPGPDAQVVAAPATPAPEATPAAPEAAPTPPEHPELDSNWFPRSYVEEVRNEAKTRREALAPFEEAFTGLHETDRNAVLDFARTLKADPAAAGGMAKQFADLLTAQEQAAVNNAMNPVDPTQSPITVAQVQQMLDTREKQVQEQAAIDAVFSQARDLGYDPDTPRGGYLLLEAWKNHDGDLAKAAEALKAEGQQQIDTFVQGKRESAKKAPVTPGGATPPGANEPVKTMQDAEAAMRARLTRQLVGEGR